MQPRLLCSFTGGGSSSSSSGKQAAPGGCVCCPICLEAITRDSLSPASFVLSCCMAEFCYACLQTYVDTSALSNRRPVCPSPSCRQLIGLEECRSLCGSEGTLDRLETLQAEEALAGVRKIYCPHKECSAMMILDEPPAGRAGAGAGSISGVSDQQQCVRCHRGFCCSCNVPWHTNLTCAQYGALPANERSNEDRQLLDLAGQRSWQRCPQCSAVIELREGCNHITCVCKHEFCYKCGKVWADRQTEGACSCDLFDAPAEPPAPPAAHHGHVGRNGCHGGARCSNRPKHGCQTHCCGRCCAGGCRVHG